MVLPGRCVHERQRRVMPLEDMAISNFADRSPISNFGEDVVRRCFAVAQHQFLDYDSVRLQFGIGLNVNLEVLHVDALENHSHIYRLRRGHAKSSISETDSRCRERLDTDLQTLNQTWPGLASK